jgi:hypothetical protein
MTSAAARNRFVAGKASGLIVCLALVLTLSRAHADDGVPAGRFDLAPYRVMVRVTFAADPNITPALRQSVLATLTGRISATFGPTWSLLPADHPRMIEDNDVTPPDEQYLDRLTYGSIAAKVGDASCQKAFLLFIRPQESRWLIAGREWDRTVQRLGPLLTATTTERRAIADAALELLEQLFSPLLMISDADRESKSATAIVHAGSIPPGDPSAVPLKKGSLFLTYFRFLDAKGNVRKVQLVPWTYLVLDEFKEGRAKCAVASSYRAPLAANMRRRVEAVAILLRPSLAETRLKLVAGRGASKALAGLFVEIEPLVPNASQKGVDAKQRRQLLSDRQGEVTIGAEPVHPMRLLQIHSGSVLLARRPFVAGVDPEVSLELADDEIRLSAQRDVDLLRIQLIETVARRASLIARTRAALKAHEAESTTPLLADLDHLPKADFYQSKLNEIRVVALDEAGRRRDAVAERRIEDLCQKTLTLIEQYLPDDRLQTLHEEVATSLAEAQTTAAALKEATEQKRKLAPAFEIKPAPAAKVAKKKKPEPAAKAEESAKPDDGAKSDDSSTPEDAAKPAAAAAPAGQPQPPPAAPKEVEKPKKPPSGL